jgi:hypothetical protein
MGGSGGTGAGANGSGGNTVESGSGGTAVGGRGGGGIASGGGAGPTGSGGRESGAGGTTGRVDAGGDGPVMAGHAAVNGGGSGGTAGATRSGGTAGPTSSGGGSGTDGSGTGGDGIKTASFANMWSATVVATPSQQLMSASGVNTYRTYLRTRASGRLRWAFWVSNGVDSTYGGGASAPNKIGGTWKIEAAYVADGGAAHSGNVVAGTQVEVTFGGSRTKTVSPGEKFWSDPVALDLPAGHDLAFTWALSGTGYPFVSATFLSTYRVFGGNAAGQEAATGFSAVSDPLVAPEMLAYDYPVTNRLCFLGDSITQGVATGNDTYGYWVAKIGVGLSPDIGVWNLGSGWARAADAASDGYWLYKAKQCDEVAVILGVNDFGSSGRTSAEVLADLTTIIGALKKNNPSTKTILFTIPTFNFTGTALTNWRAANTAIRTSPPAGTDRVFDMAAVESRPAPNDGMLKTQYMSGDAHPNDLAGTDIANAFLSWYRTK